MGHNQRSFAEPDPTLEDKARIDERDILQAARRSLGVERLDRIEHAALERSGGISVVPKQGGERLLR